MPIQWSLYRKAPLLDGRTLLCDHNLCALPTICIIKVTSLMWPLCGQNHSAERLASRQRDHCSCILFYFELKAQIQLATVFWLVSAILHVRRKPNFCYFRNYFVESFFIHPASSTLFDGEHWTLPNDKNLWMGNLHASFWSRVPAIAAIPATLIDLSWKLSVLPSWEQ